MCTLLLKVYGLSRQTAFNIVNFSLKTSLHVRAQGVDAEALRQVQEILLVFRRASLCFIVWFAASQNWVVCSLVDKEDGGSGNGRLIHMLLVLAIKLLFY